MVILRDGERTGQGRDRDGNETLDTFSLWARKLHYLFKKSIFNVKRFSKWFWGRGFPPSRVAGQAAFFFLQMRAQHTGLGLAKVTGLVRGQGGLSSYLTLAEGLWLSLQQTDSLNPHQGRGVLPILQAGEIGAQILSKFLELRCHCRVPGPSPGPAESPFCLQGDIMRPSGRISPQIYSAWCFLRKYEKESSVVKWVWELLS